MRNVLIWAVMGLWSLFPSCTVQEDNPRNVKFAVRGIDGAVRTMMIDSMMHPGDTITSDYLVGRPTKYVILERVKD